MSGDELQAFLDKNAKWHRDRRARDTKVCMTGWINYYLMRAKNADSNERRLLWLDYAEKEKLKHNNLRAPDSRALLSQLLSEDSSAIEIAKLKEIVHASQTEQNKAEK